MTWTQRATRRRATRSLSTGRERRAAGLVPVRLLLVLSLVVPFVGAMPATAQNLLLNPGFENINAEPNPTPTEWLPFPSNVDNFSIATGDPFLPSTDRFTALEGTRGMLLFGQFTGAENESLVYQEFPTTPGESFRFSGSALVHPANPLTEPRTWARLDLRFYDDSFALLGRASSDRIDLDTPQQQWIELEAAGTAPPGTTRLLAAIVFMQCEGETSGCFDSGTVYWDDMSVVPAPPAAPVPVGSVTSTVALLVSLTLLGFDRSRRPAAPAR